MTDNRLLHQEHRLGGDNCLRDTRDSQNNLFQSYQNLNYYPLFETECKENVAEHKPPSDYEIENYLTGRRGYGYADPCIVDRDSFIRNDVAWTHGRGKSQLSKRVFTAVPDMGTGGLIPNVDSRIRIGEDTARRRTCDVLSEASLFDHHILPMNDCLRNTVQDPKHIIPEWTWGGELTRDYVRQEDAHAQPCRQR